MPTVTIERETLERAAQALAYCYTAIENMSDDEDDMISRSNSALRAALAAQPVKSTMTLAEFCAEGDRLGVTAADLADALKDRPEFADCRAAQPAEPVAVNEDEVICPNCCAQFRAIPGSVQRLMLDAGFEPPFTAAPPAPAAVPLTDEQIIDIWAGVSDAQSEEISMVEFTRAVERAHGIGDKP